MAIVLPSLPYTANNAHGNSYASFLHLSAKTTIKYSTVCDSQDLAIEVSFLFFLVTEEEGDLDASSLIPLDDGLPTDYGAIEVVQCLIDHHNAIFTDANETIWR